MDAHSSVKYSPRLELGFHRSSLLMHDWRRDRDGDESCRESSSSAGTRMYKRRIGKGSEVPDINPGTLQTLGQKYLLSWNIWKSFHVNEDWCPVFPNPLKVAVLFGSSFPVEKFRESSELWKLSRHAFPESIHFLVLPEACSVVRWRRALQPKHKTFLSSPGGMQSDVPLIAVQTRVK